MVGRGVETGSRNLVLGAECLILESGDLLDRWIPGKTRYLPEPRSHFETYSMHTDMH
jgi:hypothetical protein